MLIAAVLCLCAAFAIAGLGIWLLTRPKSGDYVLAILRGVAPIQLAAGGAVALSAEPQTGLVVIIVCVIGAISTVAAGCWQSAKVVARVETAQSTEACGGACASCTLSCNSA
jgi:hypothetical protein